VDQGERDHGDHLGEWRGEGDPEHVECVTDGRNNEGGSRWQVVLMGRFYRGQFMQEGRGGQGDRG
jgi:hypothetical protein